MGSQRESEANLKRTGWGTLILGGLTLALASVAPNIFPAAEAGYSSMSTLAKYWLIPSIIGLAVIALLTRKRNPLISRSIAWGALSGGIATIALEVVRIIGFHLGYMPGSLPKLMGVLLLNRFMLGPNLASDLAGWGYHFWNGAAFGIIFVLFVGTKRIWAALPYALAIAVGFMVSPVVRSLGIGYFGLQFSVGFPVVVFLAHIGYGLTLGWLAHRFLGSQPSTVLWSTRFVFGRTAREDRAAASSDNRNNRA